MKTNWITLFEEHDTNAKYEIFANVYTDLYNIHFPIETVKLKVKDIECPWMTQGMKKSSKMKQSFTSNTLKLKLKRLKETILLTRISLRNLRLKPSKIIIPLY